MNNSNMPAYPTGEKLGDASVVFGGITKREYFAAKALQGVCASCDEYGNLRYGWGEAADLALERADTMLKKLEDTK